MSLASSLVGIVGLLFATMGIYALVWPQAVVSLFGTSELTVDGRNEVRAVYGGFGLVMGGLLIATLLAPSWSRGVYLTLSLALYGMAAGRIYSHSVDGAAGFAVWMIFLVELAGGSALLFAFFAGLAGAS